MTNPYPDRSMKALMARPHAELTSADTDLLKSMLVTAALAVQEADTLEQVSATAASDPTLAKAILLNAFEGVHFDDVHYPMACKRITDQLDVLIAKDADASVLARRLIEACDLFRRSPDRFLPGAVPAEGVRFLGRAYDMDGFVEVDGVTVPWVFASAGVGRTTLFEVSQYIARTEGVDRAIVVGSHMKEGVTLPDSITFVELPVDAVALKTGRRA